MQVVVSPSPKTQLYSHLDAIRTKTSTRENSSDLAPFIFITCYVNMQARVEGFNLSKAVYTRLTACLGPAGSLLKN